MKKDNGSIGKVSTTVIMCAMLAATAFGADSTTPARALFCYQGGGDKGGAGGISPSLQWLDLSPVKDVATREADLGIYTFDFSDNGFMLVGGMGYGGTRCGAKVGGGGWFGYKKYLSDSRNVALRDSLGSVFFRNGDTVKVDSTAQLYTMIAYGGFLAEKNVTAGNVTLNIGGLFGGGALILGKNFLSGEKNSAFTTVGEYDTANLAQNWTVAPLLCFDIHSGISYKISSFMVVGADANLLFFHSNSGFNFNTDSFLTMNPGIRFRILFGNLG
ncbi:MAG: hypothetical protein JXA71_03900 [Chitinispirillaceae bacterium]|nr:hypothetical protein [Chitinispirillaceae bacterium]